MNSTKRLVQTVLSAPPSFDGMVSALLSVFAILVGSLIYWETSLTQFMPVSLSGLEQGEYYRLVTALFAHGDMKHFLGNAYMFFLLSLLVTGYFGWMAHPIWGLGLATLTNYLTLFASKEGISLIGASGWVYVLAGMWLSLFLAIERRHSLRSRLIRVIGVSLAILFPSTFEPNVSYAAHGIGYLVGAVFGIGYFYWNRQFFHDKEVYEIRYEL